MIRCCNLKEHLRVRRFYVSSTLLLNQLHCSLASQGPSSGFCEGMALEGPRSGFCLLQDHWRKDMASVSAHADLTDFHLQARPTHVSTSPGLRQRRSSNLVLKTASSGFSNQSTSMETQTTSPNILVEWRESVIHLWPRMISMCQFPTGHPPRHHGNRMVLLPMGVLGLPVICGFGIAIYRCCNGNKPSARQKKKSDSNLSHQTFLTHTPRALGRRMLFAGVLRHDTPHDLSAVERLSIESDTGTAELPGDAGVVNTSQSQPRLPRVPIPQNDGVSSGS